ncbi:endonuclease VII [Streptomyces phage Mulchroom]|nr:endonuclease VII [Streptomyces phage Mulchroom]
MKGPCSFPGCNNEILCKALCLGHYTQQRRGKPLTPLAYSAKHTKIDEHGKTCKKCNEHKPFDAFYDQKNGGAGKFAVCKECQKEATRRAYDKKRKGFTPTFRDENGKVCPGCNEYKPYEKYYRSATSKNKDGRQSRCSKCQSDAQKVRYAKKVREKAR